MYLGKTKFNNNSLGMKEATVNGKTYIVDCRHPVVRSHYCVPNAVAVIRIKGESTLINIGNVYDVEKAMEVADEYIRFGTIYGATIKSDSFRFQDCQDWLSNWNEMQKVSYEKAKERGFKGVTVHGELIA